MSSLSRRHLLQRTAGTLLGLAFAKAPLDAFGLADPLEGAVHVPFVDVQPFDPKRRMVQWAELKEWMTPTEDVFTVGHYGTPTVDAGTWRLEVRGMVKKARTLTLDEIKARPRKEIIAAIECSGNGAGTSFMGAVGNVRWTGTPLAALLKECGLHERGVEIVFYGADQKTEKIREGNYDQRFARSLSRQDALRNEVLLAYEMNGQPLNVGHGFPLRLVVPGWYGVAWVKWLSRIEVQERRFMSKFMGRDYVTIRGEELDGETVWKESSVSWMNVKSMVGRLLKLRDGSLRFTGAAWGDGTPIESVEVSVDGGPWWKAQLHQPQSAPYGWSFWSYDWKYPVGGEHSVVCRATDVRGVRQPSAEDPRIKLKKTYWEASQQHPRRFVVA